MQHSKVVKKWPRLKSGDLIDVVAPASKCPEQDLYQGIEKLKELGFEVRIPKNIFGDHLLHSHRDEIRAEQLYSALSDSESKAVWCARGGYGSMKLLPYLAKQKVPKYNKVLLGLSDITSLHVFLNQNWGWSTLHAPILSRIGVGNLPSKSTKELFQILNGEQESLLFKNLKFLGKNRKNLKTEISGVLKGGNLTTLIANLGTPYELVYKNSLVFLEDVGERGYRIDRMIEQLIQSKRLNGCRAIILGDFTEGHEPNGKNHIQAVWKMRAVELMEKLNIPVFSGIPAGHGDIQRTVPLGTKGKLIEHSNRFELTVETGCIF